MSKMVSARVPDALFEQGSLQLEALGSNATELVRAAFEYVLKNKALPTTEPIASKQKQRKLTAEQRKQLQSALRACTLNVNISADIASNKQAVRDARSARYEALA